MVMDEEIGENIGGRSNGHVNVLKSTKHINTDRQIIQESTWDLGFWLLISNLLIPWQKGGWKWEKGFPS